MELGAWNLGHEVRMGEGSRKERKMEETQSAQRFYIIDGFYGLRLFF